jgi:PAS domain S-box-containing protein
MPNRVKQKLQQQIGASEKRFRAMVENGSDAIAIINQNASPLYLSPGFELILGYPHNDAMAMQLLDLVHADDIAFVQEKFADSIAYPGKPIRNIPARVKHKQGHWVWTLSTLTNFLSDPDIGGIIDNITDITEEKELEAKQQILFKQLEERNTFIESILQNLPIGISVHQITDGKATAINKKFAETYGWSDGELTDVKTFFEKVYPDEAYRKAMISRIMEDVNSGDPDRMYWKDVEITTQTGEKRVINAKNIPLYDQNLMISTVIDVTNEAMQAAEIMRAKANQEALINSTKDMIWSIDSDLKLIAANKSYREMMKIIAGKDIKEGDPILMYEFGLELTNKWKSYYERALGGELFSIKEQLQTAGNERTVHSLISFNPIYNNEGDILGVACYAKDITTATINLQALEKTKSELSKIMDSSLDMICVVSEDSYFLTVSAACKTILGYTPDEMVGKPMINFLHPDDQEKTVQTAAKIISGNSMTYVQNRYIHKDGSIVPLMWSAKWDPLDRVRYGIARDATEQKKSEALLIESERKYKHLFENNPMPIIIWDFETLAIIDVNTEAELLYGYTKEEFLQLTTRDIRPPEDVEVLENAVKTEDIYGQIHRRIWRHKKKSGEIMYMDITGHLIDYNGRRVSVALSNDVTEKLKAENELKESEEKYRMLFMASPVSKWIYDLDTLQILDVNDAAVLHYGYSRNEFLSMTIKDIRPKEDIPALLEAQKNVRKMGETQDSGVFTHQKKDGTLMKVNVAGNSFTYEGKNCRMVVCTDVTEHWYYNELNKLEKVILEKNAEPDSSLKKLLDYYLQQVEKLHPCMICSIQEKRGEQLFNMSSPGLPKEFLKQIEGGSIGPNAGSCGTAAFFKQKIIVTDIATDFHWNDYKEIAEKYNLKACWSNPILDRKGSVMATFACYYKETRTPSAAEENTIERAGHLLQVILESYQREKSLKLSNQRYEYATKATNDAIWDWDLSTGTLYWGDGFQTTFGFQRDTIANDITSWTDHIHPDDKGPVVEKIFQFIESNETNWEDQYQFEKANGEYAFVSDNGFVIRDDKGKAIRMVGAMQDITKQKREELRLRLLESVITTTNDAVLITEAEPFDQPGPRILYVNEAFTKITGYTAAEVIGKTPRILQGPQSDKEELKRLSEAMRKWEPCEISTINYKKNGEEYWINFTVYPVADKNGWYTHWVAIERDITHQKNEEIQKALLAEAVNQSLRERNTILESIGDAFFAMDENWVITYWNNMAEKVLGKSKQDALYRQLAEVYEDSVDSLSFAKYKEAIETKQSVHFEDYYAPLDKWYEISAYPSADGLSVYFKDVTERLNYIKAIEEQNQKLREISWMQSHVIRAPLARIMGLIPMIADEHFEEKEKMLEYLRISANDLDEVIRNITEKTKI